MTVDLTGIYNLALDALGARAKVSSPNENSREAEVCNLWFPAIRDQVLAAARWPEATKMKRLAQLSLQEDDEWLAGEARPGYTYAYALPADCLRPQYVFDYSAFEIQHYDEESRALFTNLLAPILVYTFRNELISLWSSELKMAVVFGLSANICMTLTGKPSRTKMLLQQANANILAARESAANTNHEFMQATPDWISARGFTDPSQNTQYFYPYGSLLASTIGVG